MKKILLVTLSIMLLLTLLGCETGNNGNSNDDKLKSNDELYLKAIDILDEFDGDQRIKDFRDAYDLLMTLPNDADEFVAQLSKANKIFEKYNVELKYGDYYFTPYIEITQEGIDRYKSRSVYYDASDLMESIVYPVLFEKYGNEAQSIKGITANNIITAIKSNGDYTLDKKTEQYDGCKEEWKNKTTSQLKYEITYHSNGLVERITVPFFISDRPLNDNEFADFFEKDLAEQKIFASERFQSMLDEIDKDFMGYEVLSQIFSDEEILVIINYIQSLTIDEIWEKDFYNYGNDYTPNNYAAAAVYFDYNGVRVGVTLGLNRITLNISSKDSVNSLSTNWFTLWCGMCFPEDESRNEMINGYRDILNNNVEANSFVPDWSFDLDANAHKYKAS